MNASIIDKRSIFSFYVFKENEHAREGQGKQYLIIMFSLAFKGAVQSRIEVKILEFNELSFLLFLKNCVHMREPKKRGRT